MISIACIQHFPTGAYFNAFLESINDSKFKKIIFQYRYNSFSGITLFRENPYAKKRDIVYSCYTNSEDICKKLTNYKMINLNQDIGRKFVHYIYLRRKHV